MTARTLTTAVALFGLVGSAVAQADNPTPAPTTPAQTAPAPSPATTSPGTQTQPTPTAAGGSVVYPNPGVVYPGGVIQSGYAQPMMYSPQGQVMPAGYAQPMTYTQPGVVTYGSPTMGGIYPTIGTNYPSYSSAGVSSGTAYPSFANGYANMTAYSGGTVGNVVTMPTRVARRLFRR